MEGKQVANPMGRVRKSAVCGGVEAMLSYDLMVFEPSAAPAGHAKFMSWYEALLAWDEPHSYDDHAVTTPQLKAWFLDMIESFPPLNGPLSPAQLPEDDSAVSDYCIGERVVYVAFAWSKADAARTAVFQLAEKHGLGFFDVRLGGEEVWLPVGGKLVLSHSR